MALEEIIFNCADNGELESSLPSSSLPKPTTTTATIAADSLLHRASLSSESFEKVPVVVVTPAPTEAHARAMLLDSKDPKGQTFTTLVDHYGSMTNLGNHHESTGFAHGGGGNTTAFSNYARSPKFDRAAMREVKTKTSTLSRSSGTIFITVRLMITKLKLFLYFVFAISTGDYGNDNRSTAFARSDKTLAVQFEVKKKPKQDALSVKKTKSVSTSRLLSPEPFPDPGWAIKLMIYLSYGILIGFGYLRNFLTKIGVLRIPLATEQNREGYEPLYKSWQGFFTEHIYRRVSDIFHQPISSNPGGIVRVIHRVSNNYNRTFELTDNSYDCINLASYNYLGFSKPTEEDEKSIVSTIQEHGVAVAPTHELGVTSKLKEVEALFAEYLGVEDSIVFGMGFATNACNIQALVAGGEGNATDCLLISDKHNHSSVRLGMFLSGASYNMFKHNDLDDLEKMLRNCIVTGNPRTGNRWRKIIIIVEGVYSMEGTIVNLPRLIELKKKYKCYLYIDEAHSIGAIGPNGRGIVDYYGCQVSDVDILMGTMTKSFAAAGGYIAGRRETIQHIRRYSAANYGGAMSAPIAQQIINKLRALMDYSENSDGRRRIRTLLENTHYMREQLKKLGFIIYGNEDSPVIPIMVYFPSKVWSIVRSGVREGVALVAAGYPATSLATCRIRLCMTAAHTKETLDKAIKVLSRLGDIHQIKYAK